jgi:TonB family protein
MSAIGYVARVALLAFCAVAFGQQEQMQSKTTLASLFDPVYPPLARQARITGDVKVAVTIRPDGTIETAVESGHPMLRQAALDSVQKSHFECRMCGSPSTYILVYAFTQVEGKDCCTAFSLPVQVKQEPALINEQGQPQTRVTISAEAICLCDPAAEVTKVRSIKCLYLWRCSVH